MSLILKPKETALQKPHLNLAVIGHVDHGKSTLVGHLLVVTGYVDEKGFKELEEQAKKMGKEDFVYAWVTDRLKEERERGVTIEAMHVGFETPKYFITIIDLPGHRDFVKNMIVGASQADAALLVVSARPGEFETGIGPQGQTREHLFLAATLGIRQIIVAVNKMDVVNYDQKRYEQIKAEVSKFMKLLGYDPSKVPFIPVSALKGDNIKEKSSNMPWYNGPTLLEALDALQPPPRPVDKPFRLPIQDVYTITGAGTVVVGRVETGVLKVGDRVVVMPPAKVGDVRSIETHHMKLEQAQPGDNIGINVRGIEKEDVKRGDVMGHLANPPTVAEEIVARIAVLWHPTAIGPGYTPVLHIHTATVPAQIVELIAKLDPRTGQTVEQKPQFIKQGDVAVVRLKPLKDVVVEKYSDFPGLGRFALRDMGRTIAAGQIIEIKPKKVEIKA
ncbi:translation elongation factor EF-1 subunit alpha [Vulcanisaeta distributa]|uniref:Elongation factor 1-alpha n=1 Tax=Vulcanisaeta distributa (strain DSM 14429 / JCM 11212 / NBRC 100878 / IC-017) TaxID=572478 RepID=E1QNC7_VULDI|nr:translation elongation factor EF-1 subunit alpha [Vulcanisaeta distributa]ADN50097.1 translation elongation factor EF-1, subunit alpha [Vulcanisaeta distributa DSM 14429]